jgi:hypothetical protein
MFSALELRFDTGRVAQRPQHIAVIVGAPCDTRVVVAVSFLVDAQGSSTSLGSGQVAQCPQHQAETVDADRHSRVVRVVELGNAQGAPKLRQSTDELGLLGGHAGPCSQARRMVRSGTSRWARELVEQRDAPDRPIQRYDEISPDLQ